MLTVLHWCFVENELWKIRRPPRIGLLKALPFYKHQQSITRLYRSLVDCYLQMSHPLCGIYERGDNDMFTKCVNEFLLVYTKEHRRFQVSEEEVAQLERQYEIRFNRANMKFVLL
jgi:hypothetical protein